MSYRQRRAIVKIFVFSRTDYILWVQPLTAALVRAFENLERMAASFVLGCKVAPHQVDRATRLSGLLPVRIRRQKLLFGAIARFASRALDSDASEHVKRAFDVIRTLDTVGVALRMFPLRSPQYAGRDGGRRREGDEGEGRRDEGSGDESMEWKKNCTKTVTDSFTHEFDRFARKIPRGDPMVPVLLSHARRDTKHKAVLWYLNKLTVSAATHGLNDQIRTILHKRAISEDDEMELDQLMDKFTLTTPARRARA